MSLDDVSGTSIKLTFASFRFLFSKLIAWKSNDFQPLRFVLSIHFLETLVLGREPALGCHIYNEDKLSWESIVQLMNAYLSFQRRHFKRLFANVRHRERVKGRIASLSHEKKVPVAVVNQETGRGN